MSKMKRFAETGALALLCLGLTAYTGIKTGEQEDAVPSGKRLELSWYSDLSLWEPGGWNTQKETGTGRITDHTGVEINYIIPEDNEDVRLSLMMINKNMPDIISVSDQKMMQYLVASGEVWRIDELMETYYPQSHLLTDYPEDVKETLIERDGGWYGLLSNLHSADNRERYEVPSDFWGEMQQKRCDYGIIWNKALLKRLELPLNGLYKEEDVLNAFQTAKDREATVNGNPVIPLLLDGSRFQKTTLQVLFSFWGGDYFDENGIYRENILTEESENALLFLNKVMRENYADAEQLVMSPYQVRRTLNSGQVLCFIGDIANSGIDPLEWVSSGVILATSGEKPVLYEKYKESRKTMTFISKSCEYPEAAARWLDYMTSEAGMEAYLSDCEDEWWPLRDDDWYYSVQLEPDSQDEAWMQLLCAFVRSPETQISERVIAFETLQGRTREMETEVNKRRSEGLNELIMAESEAAFAETYQDFIESLKDAGIEEVEKARRRMIK